MSDFALWVSSVLHYFLPPAIEAIPLPKRSNEAIADDLEGLAADLEYTVNAHREANANWIRDGGKRSVAIVEYQLNKNDLGEEEGLLREAADRIETLEREKARLKAMIGLPEKFDFGKWFDQKRTLERKLAAVLALCDEKSFLGVLGWTICRLKLLAGGGASDGVSAVLPITVTDAMVDAGTRAALAVDVGPGAPDPDCSIRDYPHPVPATCYLCYDQMEKVVRAAIEAALNARSEEE
jgi:hypothetical protein